MVTPDSEKKIVAQAILNWKENRMEGKTLLQGKRKYDITFLKSYFKNRPKICLNSAQSTKYV